MDKEELRNWVDEKLEDGYSESQISSILRKHGYSDEIIDQVEQEKAEDDGEEKPETDFNFENQEIKTDTDDSNSKIREIRQKIGLKTVLIPVIGLLVVSGGYLAYDNADTIQNQIPDIQFSNSSEEVERSQNMENENEQKTKKVVLKGKAPEPTRASITTDESIEFVNQLGQKAVLSSESLDKEIEIPSSGSKVVEFNSITYYTVEISGEEGSLQGSVYVE